MSRFFIGRPIVAIVIAIVTVLGGLVALAGLPISQFPQIVPPQISVIGSYPGADSLTIEQSVATPLEQQMNGVDDMLYMQSTNGNDGTVSVTVTFDVDTVPNLDQVNVQNRMAQAQPNLPPEVSQFGLTMRKQTGLPMMIISLYSPKRSYDALFLANYANINILDALYRVPGVGEARIFGAGDYAMRIWLQPDALARLGLTVPDIAAAIRQQSAVNPAGQVGAMPVPAGQEMTYTVRAQGRLQTEEEFGAIAVRSNPDGSVIRLRDVARVQLGALNYQQIGRVNGEPGCALAVFQAPGSNALDVAEGVKQVMTELGGRFPSDLAYAYTLNTTDAVSEGIREILITLVEAMVLVVFVVYLFLQNWRATLIPAVAVPVSLIGTFAVFPLLGFSVNTLSLFGLVLAIGLVVDDAIVVVEAVEHHIEQGMAPRAATIRAMEEVSGPVVSIALILATVFLPVAFMSGIQGRLNKQFALTIAISVLISAFNALTLSPALAAMWLRPRTHGRLGGRFFDAFNRTFDRASRGYVRVSHALIRRAVIGVAILAGFALLAGGLGRALPTSFVPEEDYGYFLLNVQLPPAASLQRTDEVARKVEAILAKTPGIHAFNAIIGFSLLTRVTAPNNGFYFVGLNPWSERGAGLDARSIVDRLNARFRTEITEGTRGGQHAAVDSRARLAGRLHVLAAGSQRRLDRLPRDEHAEVPRRGAQAAGARQRRLAVQRDHPAGLRRRRSRQGAQAGGRARRCLSDDAGVPGRTLRQPVQPLRPAVARVPPGGRAGALDAGEHRRLLRAQQRRADGADVVARSQAAGVRPAVHQPVQRLQGGADHRGGGAGLQLRPGAGHARGGRPGDAAAGDEL